MRQDRRVELQHLVNNLEMLSKDNGEKYIVFTTDTDKCDIYASVNEVAKEMSTSSKIAVITYTEPIVKEEGICYIHVGTNDTVDSIEEKTKYYSLVLVICPNMLEDMTYLHTVTYAKQLVIFAKKWKSKVTSIKMIADIAREKDMNVLGAIYEK